jgi:diguanylate cyclase (GGDEF)-like protein/PAS domain S-box-containing protein
MARRGPEHVKAGIAAALKHRETSLRVIFENIEDIVYLLDVEDDGYRFVAVNPRFLAATGLAEDQVIGRRVEQVIPEPSLGEVLGHYASALESGKPVYWEEESHYPSGIKHGEVMVAPVRDVGGRFTQLVGVVHDITERHAAAERLHRLAHHDTLTGLPNRRQLHECLEAESRSAQQHGGSVALLYLDVDRFKHVNDTLGHLAGDEVLRQVAERILRCTRPRDIVGRFGGDEFGIVAPISTYPGDASALAAKLMKELQEPLQVDGHEVVVTSSIGIAVCPADTCDTEAMIRYADTAMYQAKAVGRNAVRFYTPRMNEWARDRRELESALRRALVRKEFVLHYQPQIDIRSGRWTGAEALLRWQRPGKGLVAPDAFIRVLEETGLIVAVGQWAIDAACRQLEQWRATDLAQLNVSVNVSARQVGADHRRDVVDAYASAQLPDGIAEYVEHCLRNHGGAVGRLELELTESTLMAHAEQSIALLDKLKRMGTRILVDDFGTGYSSLAYLKRFPIDTLKIDKDFVRDLVTDQDDRAIVRAIIGLAHSMNLRVIAEGVETQEQLAFLREEGCDEAQGYYFARPLPALEATQLLQAGPSAQFH